MRLFFIISLLILIFSDTSFAYRPFITEDAGVAGSNVAQLETSYDYIKWDKGNNEGQLLFVPIYGIGDRLEISFEIPYLFHSFKDEGYSRGGGDINCVAKLLVLEMGEFYPSFTLKGVVKTDSGNPGAGTGSGNFDYSLQAVFSYEINKFLLHGNFGYSIIGHNRDENIGNIYIYGAGVDYNLFKNIHLISEIAGNRHPDRTLSQEQVQAVVGAIFLFTEMLSFDFAFRIGLTDVSPEWSTTFGLTLTYGGV